MNLLNKFKKYFIEKTIDYNFKESIKLDQISLRDPYILLDGNGGYILTGTAYYLNYSDSFGCVIYKSKNKLDWTGPYVLLDKNKMDKEYSDFWAPEIHYINNKYYLLITLTAKGEKRGTYLFESNSAEGGYKMLCRVTPPNYFSLDATFYEEDGELWVIYCYEWLEAVDGHIRILKINKDFKSVDLSSDKLIFKASANLFNPKQNKNKITDGPFLFKENGNLFMLWSTTDNDDKYLLLLAKSDNGSIHGNFDQMKPIYTKDGGHGMVFKDYDNKKYFVFHSPNKRKFFKKIYEQTKILSLNEYFK